MPTSAERDKIYIFPRCDDITRSIKLNLFFYQISFPFQIMKLMNSILGDKLFNMLMKSTFYGHFVAGEDQIKIVPTLER